MFKCKAIHIKSEGNQPQNWVTREQRTEYLFPLITDADSSEGERRQCMIPHREKAIFRVIRKQSPCRIFTQSLLLDKHKPWTTSHKICFDFKAYIY